MAVCIARRIYRVYLVMLAAAICGFFGAPLWTIVLSAATLSSLTWHHHRWAGINKRAHEIDTGYRELAQKMWTRNRIEHDYIFAATTLAWWS